MSETTNTSRPRHRGPDPQAAAPAGRPTLLVFTLGPEAEVRRRRLLPAPFGDREKALHRAFLEEAMAAGRAADCRVEIAAPADSRIHLPGADAIAVGQRGECFGARFAHAFEAAVGRASGPVVAVGTDTPELRPEHVERAVAALSDPAGDDAPDDRVVIGPSPDGGLYLLAARRPLGALLRRVRWCRKTTLAHLRALLTEAGFSVTLLEPVADLDRRTDLEGWLAVRRRADGTLGATGRLATAIARLLADLRRPFALPSPGRPRTAPVLARRSRAPPRLVRR